MENNTVALSEISVKSLEESFDKGIKEVIGDISYKPIINKYEYQKTSSGSGVISINLQIGVDHSSSW